MESNLEAEIKLATRMIQAGARSVQIESNTSLSKRHIKRLYKEIKGCSPPSGCYPYSIDWFLNGKANFHSSILFHYFSSSAEVNTLDYQRQEILFTLDAYDAYLNEIHNMQQSPVLNFVRACSLILFHKSKMLLYQMCSHCDKRYIVSAYRLEIAKSCPHCKWARKNAYFKSN